MRRRAIAAVFKAIADAALLPASASSYYTPPPGRMVRSVGAVYLVSRGGGKVFSDWLRQFVELKPLSAFEARGNNSLRRVEPPARIPRFHEIRRISDAWGNPRRPSFGRS